MIRNTLIVVGPGGIGKSPMSHILKEDVVSIDPYRLRASGPRRDSNDILYANPKLRGELHLVCQALNLSFVCLSPSVEWFPQAKLLFFRVRDDWQLLVLEGLDADLGKAEIYAPVIPVILSQPQIRHVFGQTEAVVLHPGTVKLSEMEDCTELEEKTAENCRRRGDDATSVNKRVASVKEEAPAWKAMIEQGATEYNKWRFPEHAFKPQGLTGCKLVEHQISMLLQVKATLLKKNPRLEVFFKTDREIEAICQPVVR